jgi:hypothetical protein
MPAASGMLEAAARWRNKDVGASAAVCTRAGWEVSRRSACGHMQGQLALEHRAS